MASSTKNSSHQALPTTTKEAIELFDSLPPATSEQMIGRWVGSEVPTGCNMDGMFVNTGWYGKAFLSPSDAHPIIYRLPLWGELCFNPSRIPLEFMLALPCFPGRGPTFAFMTWLFSLVSCTKVPQARLDTIKFRGKHCAASIYDRAPIIDYFAKLDDDTVFGWMHMRGMETPFFYTLRREAPAAHKSD